MTRPERRRGQRAVIKSLRWRSLMKDNPRLRVFRRVSFAKRLAILERVRA